MVKEISTIEAYFDDKEWLRKIKLKLQKKRGKSIGLKDSLNSIIKLIKKNKLEGELK